MEQPATAPTGNGGDLDRISKVVGEFYSVDYHQKHAAHMQVG